MPEEWPHLNQQRAESEPSKPTEQPNSIDEQWEAKAAEELARQQAARDAKSQQAASPRMLCDLHEKMAEQLLKLPAYQQVQPVIDINMPELQLMRWLIDCNPAQYPSDNMTKTMLLIARKYPKPSHAMNAAMNCIAAKKNVLAAQETIKESGESSRQLWDIVNAFLASKGA